MRLKRILFLCVLFVYRIYSLERRRVFQVCARDGRVAARGRVGVLRRPGAPPRLELGGAGGRWALGGDRADSLVSLFFIVFDTLNC